MRVFAVMTALAFFFAQQVSAQNTAAGKEPSLVICYNTRMPYYYQDDEGKHRGIILEPVSEALTKAGITHRFEVIPAFRQLKYIQEKRPRTAIMAWYQTSDREAFARFSVPIYENAPRVAIARSDNPKISHHTHIEDLLTDTRLTILVKKGYSYGKFVNSHLPALGDNVYLTTAESSGMVRMVAGKRADYFILNKDEADAAIRNERYPPGTFKLYPYGDQKPPSIKRHLMFSKDVDPELFTRVNQALKQHLPDHLKALSQK